MRAVAILALLAACGPRTPDSGGTTGPATGTPDGFHDPLSRPEQPTLNPQDFTLARECGGCHTDHYARWSKSMHAYAMVDPVFRKLVEVRQADFDGAQDPFCTQCHTAIGTRGGEIVDGFAWAALDPVALEGVTCTACHTIQSVERVWNAGHVLDPDGPLRGPIADPQVAGAHDAAYSELFEQPELCGSCHDVVELSGLNLERPYEEWLESPAREAGIVCQDCHMPAYTGTAAPGAPERTLHDHGFLGVDVPLEPSFATPDEVEAIRADVLGLLAGAATLTVDSAEVADGQLDLVLTVRNDIVAHNLPTGSTFIRQLWLEVVVTDGAGAVLYETGTLDANGDLRNQFSALDPYGDVNLVSFASGLVDANGVPEIFPWRAAEHFSNSIPPLHERTVTLFAPVDAAATGPLTVSARLRFRTHPPFLLRALGLDALVDDVAIYDLDVAQVDVPLPP